MNLEEDHYNPNFYVNSGIVCGKSVGEFPYNCIGALYYCDGADRQFIGSGFLITSNLMLTAAHNIYQRNIESDRVKQKLSFSIDVFGDLSEKTHKVADYRYPKKYKFDKASDITHDYALIRLEQEVILPRYIKLGLEYLNNDPQEIEIIGFGESSSITQALQKRIWRADTHSINGIILMHQLSTLIGNNGSPIMIMMQGLLGPEQIAIGINIGFPYSQSHNQGRIITKDLLLHLNLWKLQMCPQISYCVISQSKMVRSSDGHDKWIQQQMKRVQEFIQDSKQSIENNNQIEQMRSNGNIYESQKVQNKFDIKQESKNENKKSSNIFSTPAIASTLPKKEEQIINFVSQQNPSLQDNENIIAYPPLAIEQKVQLKDIVISEDHFYEIAAKLEQITPLERKKIASLSLQQNFVIIVLRKGTLYSSQMQLLRVYSVRSDKIKAYLYDYQVQF